VKRRKNLYDSVAVSVDEDIDRPTSCDRAGEGDDCYICGADDELCDLGLRFEYGRERRAIDPDSDLAGVVGGGWVLWWGTRPLRNKGITFPWIWKMEVGRYVSWRWNTHDTMDFQSLFTVSSLCIGHPEITCGSYCPHSHAAKTHCLTFATLCTSRVFTGRGRFPDVIYSLAFKSLPSALASLFTIKSPLLSELPKKITSTVRSSLS
jgi:hypothetical protein